LGPAMAKFTAYTADNAPEAAKPVGIEAVAAKPAEIVEEPSLYLSECFAMIINGCLLCLSLALFIGPAAAQTPSWPIVDGRQLQPTQQQIDTKEDDKARQWNRGVQSD